LRRDAEITVWNLTNGKELCTIKEELEILSWDSVALSPDGTRLACHALERDADKKVTGYPLKVWDTGTGKNVLSIPQMRQPLRHVAFSPDGKYLASVSRTEGAEESQNAVVQLWDAATGQEHSAIKTTGPIMTCLAFSPGGTRLVTLSQRFVPSRSESDPAEATLWDVATGKELLSFREKSLKLVNNVVFSPDGKLLSLWNNLSTLTTSPTIQVWDTATGKVHLILKGHTSAVQCVAFSADGTRLHSAAVDGTLKTWAISATEVNPNPARRPRLGSGPVVVSPDGTRYLVPSSVKGDEKGLRIVDAAAHKDVCVFREHKGAVQNAAFSHDGKRIVSVAVLDNEAKTVEVKVWDAATAKVALSLELADFEVMSVTVSGGISNTTRLDGIPEAEFSPDGTLIVLNQQTLSGAKEKRTPLVKVWDIAHDKEVFATDKNTGIPSAVHFCPDGKRLIALGGTSARIKALDAVTYGELRSLEGDEVELGDPSASSGMVFSRNGSRVANVYRARREVDGRQVSALYAKAWDMTTGEELITVPLAPVWAIALSPDGRYLAASSNPGPRSPGEVKVLDLDTHKQLLTLQGHTQPVVAIAFSPDGRRIASMENIPGNGPHKLEVRIWDAATGHELLTLSSAGLLHWGLQSTKLFFSPDGSRLIATGRPPFLDEEPLIVWDATPLQEPAPQVETARETIRSWGDVIDPVGDCTFKASEGKLTITVPGTDHNLTETDSKAPRVLQAVEGDFTIQVKVTGDFDPGKDSAAKGTSFNGAGLLLWIDHENYVRLERDIFSKSGGKFFSFPPLFEYWRNGKLMTGSFATDVPFFKGRSTYLRLERRAGTLVASVSHDGAEWIALAPLRIDLPKTVRVGVDAVNTSKRPFVVEFDELKLTTK
jgi:WD40 repeat protein